MSVRTHSPLLFFVRRSQRRAPPGTDHQRIAKLDRENEVAPPPKVALSVGKAIQTARQEKELAQKELAQKVNEKPQVIADYEAGRAIPNPQILSKLERVLGVKLRGASPLSLSCGRDGWLIDWCAGANIGEKLGGPKKS